MHAIPPYTALHSTTPHHISPQCAPHCTTPPSCSHLLHVHAHGLQRFADVSEQLSLRVHCRGGAVGSEVHGDGPGGLTGQGDKRGDGREQRGKDGDEKAARVVRVE